MAWPPLDLMLLLAGGAARDCDAPLALLLFADRVF
jgi:hypothetical protein